MALNREISEEIFIEGTDQLHMVRSPSMQEPRADSFSQACLKATLHVKEPGKNNHFFATLHMWFFPMTFLVWLFTLIFSDVSVKCTY